MRGTITYSAYVLHWQYNTSTTKLCCDQIVYYKCSVKKNVGSNPRRQSKNMNMKYKTHVKPMHELYVTCFQYNVKN